MSTVPLLGYDGLGYIATVRTTPEKAAKVAASLPSVSNAQWQALLEAAESKP